MWQPIRGDTGYLPSSGKKRQRHPGAGRDLVTSTVNFLIELFLRFRQRKEVPACAGMTLPLMETSGPQVWGFIQQASTAPSGDMGYLLSETVSRHDCRDAGGRAMQEQLPKTSATERARDGLEACLRGQVPRVAVDSHGTNFKQPPIR